MPNELVARSRLLNLLSPPILVSRALYRLDLFLRFLVKFDVLIFLKLGLGCYLSQLANHSIILIECSIILIDAMFIAELNRVVDLVPRERFLALYSQLLHLLFVKVALAFSRPCYCLLLILLQKELLGLHVWVLTFRLYPLL